MITPAKWQTAEANQKIASKMTYGEFRKKIVPHMSKVVFYPDARDIFDIKQLDGITYFILDKKNDENCTVVNKCVRQKLFNNTEVRSIANRETLNNIGNAIIKYVWAKTSTRYTFSKDSKLGYKGVYIVDAMCNPGKNIVDTNGSTLLFSPMEIVMSPIDMSMLSDNATCIFESADINECKSFISWINLKLTRFIVLMNVSGYSGLMTNESFRFVPAPPSGKFDHIYILMKNYTTHSIFLKNTGM